MVSQRDALSSGEVNALDLNGEFPLTSDGACIGGQTFAAFAQALPPELP